MSMTRDVQDGLRSLLIWSSSNDCPFWGRSIVQRSLDLIEQIFQQRELGRYDALKEDNFGEEKE